jgi:hypothetical protein
MAPAVTALARDALGCDEVRTTVVAWGDEAGEVPTTFAAEGCGQQLIYERSPGGDAPLVWPPRVSSQTARVPIDFSQLYAVAGVWPTDTEASLVSTFGPPTATNPGCLFAGAPCLQWGEHFQVALSPEGGTLMVAVQQAQRPALEAAHHMDPLTHLLGRRCVDARRALGVRRGPISVVTATGGGTLAVDVACTEDGVVEAIRALHMPNSDLPEPLGGFGPAALLSIGQ